MILVVGLSPAWQRTLEYERFVVGKVNRARAVGEIASGKGVNVTRVATQLGAKVRLLTVAGGHRGKLLRQSLREQGIDASVVRVAAETRICQTLLANGFPTTELVEESGALTKEQVRQVLVRFQTELRRARLLVLSGTVPRGCGLDFYARLACDANRRGVPVLVDTQGEQLLNAVRQKPLLVKINRDELGAATGMECGGLDNFPVAVRRLGLRGAGRIVLTHGAEAVYAFEDLQKKPVVLKPPRVKSRNPIGSGDAMLAGIAIGLHSGKSMLEAVRLGIACGAANAMTSEPGFVRPSDVRLILRRLG